MTKKTSESSNRLIGFDSLPDCALVSDRTIAALAEVSKVTVWRWAREGRIPKPKKIGPNCTRWEVGPLRAAMAMMCEEKEAA